ncbi:transcription antitermination factor NusB [Candidatus Roizmanbacteria bacterium]|nr:transcription antitermination factor NusB [Candidatus Roizmanbacteria bacterium]
MDPRHEMRLKVVQNLFAKSFTQLKDNVPYPEVEITNAIFSHLEEIDKLISQYAPKYPLDRIAKTDLAILRLSIYELVIEPKEPMKVVINEAVELAKEFGGDRSYAFVNAVLGSVATNSLKNSDEQSTKPV